LKPVAISENHLYSKVYKNGRKFVGRCIVFYALADRKAIAFQKANPEKLKINRLGITVTRKIGDAVIRSRVKRILREGWRLVNKEYRLKCGFLVVIVARDSAVTAKTDDVKADLIKACKMLDMLEACHKED